MTFLTVLLTVLKIIGIVTGSIIGIVLLLLLWLILSPIKYKGRIKYTGKTDIIIKASYLCHIITFFCTVNEDGKRLDFRIFGKSLLNRKPKKPSKSRKRRRSKHPASSNSPARHRTHENSVYTENKALYEKTGQTETVRHEGASGNTESSGNREISFRHDSAGSQNVPDIKETPPEKIPKKNKKNVFKKLRDIYNKLKVRIAAFIDTVKRLLEKRDRLIAEIEDADNREAVSFALNMVKKFLKHILPRKHKVYLRFGTGDPARTGELLGLMCAFAALLGLNLEAEPDFENKIMECDIPFKGRISILVVGIWILQIYRNRKFMAFLDRIRNR